MQSWRGWRTSKLAEQRSLRVVFFISSLLFVLVTGWAVWNEAKTRRPWKAYQQEFNRLEHDRVVRELAVERSRFDAPEVRTTLAKLQKDLKAAQARLAGPESAKAQQLLAQREAEYAEINMKAQFIKSELDEALYWVEHAIQSKQDSTKPRAKAAAIEKQLQGLTAQVNMANTRMEEAREAVKRFQADVDAIQARIDELSAPVMTLERRLESIRARPLEVKQIVVEGLATNEFKEPILTVDRCTTCHLAIDRPGFEQARQPFRTHPYREVLFGQHLITRFGCTSCHQGQGPTLDVEAAHGEVLHWARPLLRGDFVQTSCRKCHAEKKEFALAPIYSRGRQMVEELGCFGCHMMAGFEKVQKVGPDLTRIANKVDPSWLVRWINKPRGYLPKTKMPNFGLSDEDALSIAAYLLNTSQPIPELHGEFKAPASVERGREIVSTVGCLGCHRVPGLEAKIPPAGASPAVPSVHTLAVPPDSEKEAPGGAAKTASEPKPMKAWLVAPPPSPENQDFAPDLSKIASKVNADWLFAWVKNPKQFRPTTRMPNLRLSDDDARAVTAFLMTLGQKQRVGGLEQEVRKAERIAAGERLIRKRGCFGCHDIKGFETSEKIAPDLSNFSQKRLQELFFGEAVQVKQTWQDYTFWKLKNPRIYATERVEQLMPNFGFTDEEAKTLRVFLKSLSTERVQPQFQRSPSDEELAIQNGRTLVKRYNCNGCHVIEGQGGAIAPFYANETRIPPPLEVGMMHEGEKVQATWLYQFLGRPVPLRPWLDVRMPTFGLSIEEATTLTKYFAVMGKQQVPYEYVSVGEPAPELMKAGRLLMSKDYFDCFTCHQQGEKKPEGPSEGWAPDLSLAKRRLRPIWIGKWLKDPQKIQPGTKMPSYYPDGPDDILGGKEDRQIQAITEYLMHLGEN
ncbi:c-type cytochrome [Candidatus Methylomirabilis sp.]|uniref:c-type cytochrome n=1 Tax=Candidatus Methylomirabilis sp. TaxID=2032687 RepID=UPI002A681FC4|nr:c-type cytochrome [Candidatus Methylomirabilis sp.]